MKDRTDRRLVVTQIVDNLASPPHLKRTIGFCPPPFFFSLSFPS